MLCSTYQCNTIPTRPRRYS